MTVIAMSRAEIDRMRDLAGDRIRVSEAATLMGMGAGRSWAPAGLAAGEGLSAARR